MCGSSNFGGRNGGGGVFLIDFSRSGRGPTILKVKFYMILKIVQKKRHFGQPHSGRGGGGGGSGLSVLPFLPLSVSAQHLRCVTEDLSRVQKSVLHSYLSLT